jgi:hypothetical protein
MPLPAVHGDIPDLGDTPLPLKMGVLKPLATDVKLPTFPGTIA